MKKKIGIIAAIILAISFTVFAVLKIIKSLKNIAPPDNDCI